MKLSTQHPFLSGTSVTKRPASRKRAHSRPKNGGFEILHPWRLGLWVAIMVLGVLGSFYFVLKKPGSSQQAIPLIRAEKGPIRVLPEHQEGTGEGFRHRIYKQLERADLDDKNQVVEQLLPPVEAPILTPLVESVPPQTVEKAPPPQQEVVSETSSPKPQPTSKTEVTASTTPPAPSIDQLLSHTPQPEKGKTWTLQLGPFLTQKEAEGLLQRIKRFGVEGIATSSGIVSGLPLGVPNPTKYVVFIRGFDSLKAAQQAVAQLHQRKVKAIVLKP